jgi:hypothetical protein
VTGPARAAFGLGGTGMSVVVAVGLCTVDLVQRVDELPGKKVPVRMLSALMVPFGASREPVS